MSPNRNLCTAMDFTAFKFSVSRYVLSTLSLLKILWSWEFCQQERVTRKLYTLGKLFGVKLFAVEKSSVL